MVSVERVLFGQTSPPPAPDSAQIIQFLNQTIDWYHGLATQTNIAAGPTDLLFVHENRETADQAVKLAFDFAKMQTELAEKLQGTLREQNSTSSQHLTRLQLKANLDAQVEDTRAQLDAINQQLATVTRQNRKKLESQGLSLQGALDLLEARRDALQSILDFESNSSTEKFGVAGMKARIDAVASSVPELLSEPASPSLGVTEGPAEKVTPTQTEPSGLGIWDRVSDIFSLSAKGRTIESLIRQTQALSKSSEDLAGPIVARLTELSRSNDSFTAGFTAANQADLVQQRKRLQSLTTEYKDISAAVVPLIKQRVLLDAYQKNLADWRTDTRERFKRQLADLFIRLGLFAIVILTLTAAVELWKRAVYRYIDDALRRYQFLLLRKFVLWSLLTIAIILGFASRLGSIATFAGLITAGVAVSLQNVILSAVGYFFLLGKYGVHVGDRVQVGAVKGEVIDLGFVRMHLMELSNEKADAPTGRVVSFSNSIVFQTTGGIFKQIPSIHFSWHELTVALSPDADQVSIKSSLLQAVEIVLADFKEEMERQNKEIGKTMVSTTEESFQATVQLRYSLWATEAVIRYPVDSKRASEIDERVSRTVLNVVRQQRQLGLAVVSHP